MDAQRVECPAKINLTLHVLGQRPDGFHELDSLVAQVGLCDRLIVRTAPASTSALTCDDPLVPTDESNLVLRAAACLRAVRRQRRPTQVVGLDGFLFELQKRIPPGSGLGGGSSNAAATLRTLNRLWSLGLSRAELAAFAAQLGSDVPLFLHSSVCRMRGRGERVDDLGGLPRGWVALLLPPLHCSTREVYAAYARAERPFPRASNEEVWQAIQSRPLSAVMEVLHNDLQGPAFSVCPELCSLWRTVRHEQPGPLAMSGSGSALFRLFDDAEAAGRFASRVRAQQGIRVEVVAFASGPATSESPPSAPAAPVA